jgi:drug/metabolite transporter (DMT)-like permease
MLMLDVSCHTTLKSRSVVTSNVTPERKVLLTDGLVGVSMLVNSSLGLSVPSSVQWWTVLVFVGVAVWVAGILYRFERRSVEESLRDVLVGSIVIASPVLVALAMVVSNHPLADTVVAGVFAGFGSSILGYRFVYGILRPIPEHRVERTRGRAV